MTKQEKIAALDKAMTQSKRGEKEDETFYHFTDDAPKELISLYLEHYEVRDVDHEIFSRACDIVSEVFGRERTTTLDKEDDVITDEIYEAASDSASVYTAERLGYLNIWNEEEIGQTMSEYDEKSIATACAIWYDRQVEQAAVLIKDWVNA
jgi:hypothetical protein